MIGINFFKVAMAFHTAPLTSHEQSRVALDKQ